MFAMTDASGVIPGTLAQPRLPYPDVVSRRHSGKSKTRESRAELANGTLRQARLLHPPDERDAILRDPPPDPEAFIDAVPVAEGRDLNIVLKQERRPMLDVVERWAVCGGHGPESVRSRPAFPSDM
jgi:hypothetical protein